MHESPQTASHQLALPIPHLLGLEDFLPHGAEVDAWARGFLQVVVHLLVLVFVLPLPFRLLRAGLLV